MVYRVVFFLFCTHSIIAEVFVFTPPQDWQLLHPKGDSRYIVATFAAPKSNYPPSISLAHEPLQCSQKKYLEAAKTLLSRNAQNFRALGTQQTPAGEMTLFQTEYETPHGRFSTIAVIFFSDQEAYTLSFAVKKNELASLYPLFEKVIASTGLFATPYEALTTAKQVEVFEKKNLLRACMPNNNNGQSFSIHVQESKQLRQQLAEFETDIQKIVGKENKLLIFYLLQDSIGEITRSFESTMKPENKKT